MELTPQVINEVEFSMARRGYDPDQVDEFLEKLAVAVGDMSQRLAELRDRTAAAERRAVEAEQRAADRPERVVQAGPSPAEMSAAAEAELETLKRTLLLAQRTADAAVQEAQAEAARIRAEAEANARTAHDATRRTVMEEIAALQATRDAMRDDVDALEAHMAGQRGRLEATIDDLQRLLDASDRLAPSDAPAAMAAPAIEPIPIEPAPVAPVPAPAVAGPIDLVAAEDAVRAMDDTEDDEAWARFGPSDEVLDDGPRTEPVTRIEPSQAGGEDAYLSELRKAMIDDTGAPDRRDLGLFEGPESGGVARSARFGRRR